MTPMIMASYKNFYLFIICNVCCELYPFSQSEAASVPPTNTTASHGKGGISWGTVVAIVVPISVAVLIFIVGICCFNKRRRKKYDSDPEEQSESEFSRLDSLQYDFSTIEEATNKFSQDNKLGEGGFGVVYKGTLANGQEIAVKRFRQGSRQRVQEFKNEVEVVAKLQHRNSVRLLGFCVQEEEKILVYEYIPNKSLDYILFDPEKQKQLDWTKRYKIVKGIARGIKYFHEDSWLKIIHYDLKASNVLLDNDMNPKISDFGIARIFMVEQTQENTNRIVGAYGYMTPEYAMNGEFSIKADVYAFGVLLMEIISGKKNRHFYQIEGAAGLLSYAWKLWKDGEPLELLDPTIRESYTPNEVMRCIHTALLCVQEDPADRPSMSSIVIMLENYSMTLPTPSQPAFFDRNMRRDFQFGQTTTNSLSMSLNDMSVSEVIPRTTNNFSQDNKLGEGGFGVVYKGTLANGQEVAVKRLSQGSGQGVQEFKNEVEVVVKLQHRNLVRLLGFCVQGEEKILVYEYVPNKSLDYILFDPEKQKQLDWIKRYKIVKGIARGIKYLHEDSRLKIIHRDLKASNVLLDNDMNPKISDFGMARIFMMDQTQENTSQIIGTYGYMSPEYAMHGEFSVKSDVYGFGVLVMEIISGKKNCSFYQTESAADLPSYAWKLWKYGEPLELLDPTTRESYTPNEVMRCIHIGLLCVQKDPADRPSMASIVLMLDGYSGALPTPSQPAFFRTKRN